MSTLALVDRRAIEDVLQRYAAAVDRKDLEGVASCFTPDAAYEGALGRGTIAAALAGLGAAFARYDATTHRIGPPHVVLEGDVAHSSTPCVATHVLSAANGGGVLTVEVCYHDDLVRRPDGWRIARRRVEPRGSRPDGATPR